MKAKNELKNIFSIVIENLINFTKQTYTIHILAIYAWIAGEPTMSTKVPSLASMDHDPSAKDRGTATGVPSPTVIDQDASAGVPGPASIDARVTVTGVPGPTAIDRGASARVPSPASVDSSARTRSWGQPRWT